MGISHAVRKAVIIAMGFYFEIIQQFYLTLASSMRRNGKEGKLYTQTYCHSYRYNDQWEVTNAFIYTFIHSGSNVNIWPLPCGLINVQWSSVECHIYHDISNWNTCKRFRTLVSKRAWFVGNVLCLRAIDIMSLQRHSRRLSRCKC